MNYIKEINAFYDTIERNPLSTSAVTLWHALMHINNKARWQATFTVAASILKYKASLTDSTFKRARTELAGKGYITYESRSGNQAPIYHIHSLMYDASETTNQPETSPTEPPTKQKEYRIIPNQEPNITWQTNQDMTCVTDHKTNHSAGHHPDPLIKQNNKKNKQKTDNIMQTDAHRFYQQNFGIPTPFVSKAIATWVQDTSNELVIYAMERTLERGKTTWGYTKAILHTWKSKGIRTKEAAKADTRDFRKQTQQPTLEVIPEWFQTLEQQRQHKPTNNSSTTQDEATILAQTQALIEGARRQRGPHTGARYKHYSK